MRLLALLVLAAPLAGCESRPVATVSRASLAAGGYAVAAPAASPCAAPTAFAAPCAPAAPVYAVAGDVPVYAYGIGPDDHARAALAVPPGVALCLTTAGYRILVDAIEGINCAAGQLIPKPVPTLHPATFVAAPAYGAGPCK